MRKSSVGLYELSRSRHRKSQATYSFDYSQKSCTRPARRQYIVVRLSGRSGVPIVDNYVSSARSSQPRSANTHKSTMGSSCSDSATRLRATTRQSFIYTMMSMYDSCAHNRELFELRWKSWRSGEGAATRTLGHRVSGPNRLIRHKAERHFRGRQRTECGIQVPSHWARRRTVPPPQRASKPCRWPSSQPYRWL
jgi:hypothetical protein